MRRAACAGLAGLLLSSSAAAAAVTRPLPRAALTGGVCRASSNPLDRAVAITAVMRPVAGTKRMELMFQLQEKPLSGGTFTMVKGGDLGHWRRSPGTLGQRPNDVWRVQKMVANLPPAFYRFRVGFRWSGASGRLLARTVRLGPSCYQPR